MLYQARDVLSTDRSKSSGFLAAFGAGGNLTISGTLINANAAAGTPGSIQVASYRDRVVIFTLSIAAAGAGTTLNNVTINSIPAMVWVQENQAGAMVAIVSAVVPFSPRDSIYRLYGNLSASGATGGRFQCDSHLGFSSPSPLVYGSSGTGIDTVRTVTLQVWPASYIAAAAVNDVAAANSCTWSGTAGVAEVSDTTSGTFNVTLATSPSASSGAAGVAQTIISTFAVTSVAGIALAAAVWR